VVAAARGGYTKYSTLGDPTQAAPFPATAALPVAKSTGRLSLGLTAFESSIPGFGDDDMGLEPGGGGLLDDITESFTFVAASVDLPKGTSGGKHSAVAAAAALRACDPSPIKEAAEEEEAEAELGAALAEVEREGEALGDVDEADITVEVEVNENDETVEVDEEKETPALEGAGEAGDQGRGVEQQPQEGNQSVVAVTPAAPPVSDFEAMLARAMAAVDGGGDMTALFQGGGGECGGNMMNSPVPADAGNLARPPVMNSPALMGRPPPSPATRGTRGAASVRNDGGGSGSGGDDGDGYSGGAGVSATAPPLPAAAADNDNADAANASAADLDVIEGPTPTLAPPSPPAVTALPVAQDEDALTPITVQTKQRAVEAGEEGVVVQLTVSDTPTTWATAATAAPWPSPMSVGVPARVPEEDWKEEPAPPASAVAASTAVADDAFERKLLAAMAAAEQGGGLATACGGGSKVGNSPVA
jgi:hypothetical protein